MQRYKRKIACEILAALSLFVLGVSSIWFSQRKFAFGLIPDNHPMLVAPRNISYFALGYNTVLGDTLWLRIIQDFDYCESRPPGDYNPAKFKCEEGWVYHMLDAETELDPKFRQPYHSGALMLSVIVNDIPGASKIFDKSVRQFPNDWEILYMASYQAMQEEKNLEKASSLLERAAHNGAPVWLLSLAARLRQKTGQLDVAKSILGRAIEEARDEKSRTLFQKRLDEVNAEIAKQATEPKSPSPKH